jgi:serine/threonine protein kinase
MTLNHSDTADLLGAATDTPALMLVDQKRRWFQGERVLVEEFCQLLPSLRNDTEALLDLIYSEVLLREQHGEQPKLSEYVERFPDLAEQLRLQFELDEVVHSAVTITEKSGTVIGRYTLLEKISEGGMGVVYVAQQDRPVTRQVALKIIKAGMDTKEVIARFEAERQALALMDHSNIARVFDAGATQSGRPYFVMELVHGRPITEYCEKNDLTIDERLELFVQVCHAVQHAHQKGIIHRDLKPSNVLITPHDGQGVPKIIDFGLAKATGQQLTEKTLLTVHPQMMGTPLYMSPEQAALATFDIDTRSDIYSLGVLLYELLAGTTPFDPARFRAVGFDEVRRIIREEEPPAPSTRLTSHSLRERAGVREAANVATTIAEERRTDPRRLVQAIRGDLDWIVMRCLEKDRTRRYVTASALALDIERYLKDEPVEACPPTRTYRLRKFMRRNKTGVLAGSAIMTLLVLAIVVLTVSNARIRRESDARAKALKAKDSSLATATETAKQMARLVTLIDYRLEQDPGGNVDHKAMREESLRHLELVLKQAEKVEESNDVVFVILEQVADIQIGLVRLDDARRTCQQAIEIVQKSLAAEPDSPVYLANLARVEERMLRIMFTQLFTENQTGNKEAELMAYCKELVDYRRKFNSSHPETLQPMAYCFWTLGKVALERHGDKVAAERHFQESIWRSTEYLSKNPSDVSERLTSGKNAVWLGRLLQDASADGPEKALPLFQQGHRWTQTALEDDPTMHARGTAAIAELELGICQFQVQPSEYAISLVQHASADLRRLSNYPSPPGDVLITLYQSRRAQAALIKQLQRLGRFAEAAEAARQMSDWLGEITQPISDDPNVHRKLQLAQTENVGVLCATGQLSKAVEACRQQISFWQNVQRDKPSDDFKPYLAGRYLTLVRLLTEIGQVDEAIQAAAQADEMGLTDPPTLNQLARNLVTARYYAEPLPMAWQIGPDVAMLAVEAAQQATNASPNDGNYWNTLGAAQYCAGDWQSSIKALKTSMKLRGGGDAFDWFFLAMAYWRLDQREDARTWYDKAAQWMDRHQPKDEELRHFRVGATVLIGVSEAAPPIDRSQRQLAAYSEASLEPASTSSE